MNTRTRMILAAATAAAGASGAHAGTIVHSGSLSQATTNWTRSFQVDQFDTQGGARVLEQVVIEMFANLSGTARFENRDNQSRTVHITMNSTLSIALGADVLASAAPGMGGTYNVGAFDGLIDFGGVSGRTVQALNDTQSNQRTLHMPVDDLAPWIGGGQVTLSASATAVSFASGGGNLLAMFQTTAGIDFAISYVYRGDDTPVVPLPTPAGLAGAGLGVLGAIRRRRA